jgi:hypothetical protein
MSRPATWLVSLPIVLAGIEAAHALANASFGSPAGEGELFAAERSGSELLPLVAALALGSVLLGLAARVLERAGALPGRRALPFACLPPVAFVLLELLEGLLHDGIVPLGAPLEPTFICGLVLQLPFAVAGYAVARALLRLGDRVRRLVAARPPAPPPCAGLPRGPRVERAHGPRRAFAHPVRGPPPGLPSPA